MVLLFIMDKMDNIKNLHFKIFLNQHLIILYLIIYVNMNDIFIIIIYYHLLMDLYHYYYLFINFYLLIYHIFHSLIIKLMVVSYFFLIKFQIFKINSLSLILKIQ